MPFHKKFLIQLVKFFGKKTCLHNIVLIKFGYNTDPLEMEVCWEMGGEGRGEKERDEVKKKHVFLQT